MNITQIGSKIAFPEAEVVFFQKQTSTVNLKKGEYFVREEEKYFTVFL